MAFRNDLDAAQARADALEKKVAALEAENTELREGDAGAGDPATVSGAGVVWMGIAMAAVICGVVAMGFAMDEPILAGLLGAFGASILTVFVLVNLFIEVVPPNAAVVLSGRLRTLPDGRQIGYRVVIGGRVFRIPILETADRLDLSTRALHGEVRSAYSKGNVALDVEFAAAIRIDKSEPGIHNAIERFLGRSLDEVAPVAKELLEGNLRAVIAELTIDELRSDRVKAAEHLIATTEHDFERLGLCLDTFQIQQVRER